MSLNVTYRPAEPNDLNFILNSWLKSYRTQEDSARMSNDVYYTYYKAVITHILKNAKTVVAANPEDPSQIFGYVVYSPREEQTVHYVYVKYPFRQLKIATALMQIATQGQPAFASFANKAYDAARVKHRLTYSPAHR